MRIFTTSIMKSMPENNFFSTQPLLNVKGKLLDMSQPRVMGVLNVTPDSFFDGGQYLSTDAVLLQVEKMLQDGATFIDVGGYSTRPGAEVVTPEEEIKRVVPAIRRIMKAFPDALISIDTFRSEVARAAVEEGACIINDVSGGEADARMFETVGTLHVPYILMHMRGTPQTMNQHTNYEDMLKEIAAYFQQRILSLQQQGVKDIILDPGIGFAKTVQQNFQLLQQLDYFRIFSQPKLIGVSRKSLIWRTLNITPEEALNGTSVLNTVALLKGASILRVHDVKEAVEVIKLIHALKPH